METGQNVGSSTAPQNSAAAEIRSRIYKGLSRCKDRPETDLTAALAQQDVRVRVYTIHAFALEMLRLFRYKMGLPAELRFTDEDEPLWDTCAEEFFIKKWNPKALRELLSEDEAEDKTVGALLDVFFFLSNKSNVKDFIKEKGDTLYFLAAMGKSSCFDVPKNLERVKDLLKNNLGLDPDGDYSEALLQARNRLAEAKKREAYKKSKAKLKEDVAKAEASLKKKEDNLKALEEKQQQKKLTAKQTEELAKLPDDIAQAKQNLAEKKACLADAEFLQKLCPVLGTCSYFLEKIVSAIGEELYMPRMMADGIFDFNAVVFLFIKDLVREDVNAFLAALKAEGQAFNRLYIDEAQDNDIIQNYLIVLFGQGEKCPNVHVYVVGDLKQSIYTWRDAYPREFRQMLSECEVSTANGANRLKTLRTSWRLKAQNTCDAINNVCAAIQKEYPEWWYDPAKDSLQLPARTDQAQTGKVEMWYTDKAQIDLTAGSEEERDELAALDEFFKSGKTAVAVRARKQLAAVPDLKAKLQELGANYKMERAICEAESGQAKVGTLQPELELLVLLFMALTDGQAEQASFALFWSSAGRLLTERLALCGGGQTVPEEFKALFEKIHTDIARDAVGNRVERVLDLFDKYNLWARLWHTALVPEETGPKELRRIFYHILMRAQLAENKYSRRAGRAFEADPVWTIIRKGKMPPACYSLPAALAPSEGEEHPAPDVITIHVSKGLAYENMIVVADFKKDFFGNTEDFGPFGYRDVYSQLFSADFTRILEEEPDIAVTYFPYLGLIPAHLLKNKGVDIQGPFWKQLAQSYNTIEGLIRSEKLNLLYVALTRTAKNILLLDVGQSDETVRKLFQPQDGQAGGVQVYKVGGQAAAKESPTPTKYAYEDVQFERMDIGSKMPTGSVRSAIEGRIYRKYGGRLTCLKRFEHAKKGSMVHNVMQRLIGQAKDWDDFTQQAETLCRNTPQDNALYASAVRLVAGNGKQIAEQITGQCADDLLGKDYTFYHEVPVWQFDADTRTLTKGSIDTLAVSPAQAVILEYKVLFNNNAASQKIQAAAQMQKYENMLRAVEREYTIKKCAVALSEENT